jgi:hypothetical protein
MQKGMRVPDHVTPGKPRREVAQEFFSEVLALGRYAREQYLQQCKAGLRTFDQAEIDDIDEQLATVEAELAKYK